jgi:hypothetical protein
MAFMKEAVKFIEAAPNRIEVCCAAQMPLTKKAGDVSGIDQDVGQGFFTQG